MINILPKMKIILFSQKTKHSFIPQPGTKLLIIVSQTIHLQWNAYYSNHHLMLFLVKTFPFFKYISYCLNKLFPQWFYATMLKNKILFVELWSNIKECENCCTECHNMSWPLFQDSFSPNNMLLIGLTCPDNHIPIVPSEHFIIPSLCSFNIFKLHNS